ncbi:hypothetical protein EJK55_0286 [Moraxella catarrhalis]|uniref:Uncharacterized protein n=1 Tax=Moraxella catarrhalis TaxID=480 RepID=A0A3Q9GA50_MORCA|nr:hypothetical protein EJK52_0619 [Moraxella catarrhalis]EKF84121.1 hypothetical protein MCRH_0643 [Moraxella catarrhalis RH4]AZQ90294.1 hypothetical protein EJK50_0613 [Moraxella catarrhalis]AZQ91689.1 hypothetical protein EJK51_0617 [Moraxella catarrhalis]AZQ92623.1 hypothetical protein EJK53_0622 [Moraxella catarrhalis]
MGVSIGTQMIKCLSYTAQSAKIFRFYQKAVTASLNHQIHYN